MKPQAFPSKPDKGQHFYRLDWGKEFYYNGEHWVPLTRRPQARRPNYWIGFLGVLAYGIVGAALFYIALVLLIVALGPRL